VKGFTAEAAWESGKEEEGKKRVTNPEFPG